MILNEIECASGATFDWVISNINCTVNFYLLKTCLITSLDIRLVGEMLRKMYNIFWHFSII